MSPNIIEDLKNFLLTCPYLEINEESDKPIIDVGFINDEPTRYFLDPAVYEPINKTFIDGSTLRNFVCNFSAIQYYSNEVEQNIKNFQYQENLTDWIDKQFKNKNMPKYWKHVEVFNNSGFWSIVKQDSVGQYLVQIRVIYFKER